MKLVQWKIRATPTSDRFPHGLPAEEVEVKLSDQEFAEFKGKRDRVVSMEPGPERTELVNEICCLMEMNALLDASEIPLTEEEQRARTEAMQHVESLESRGFKIPEEAKRSMEVGQLAMDEPGALSPEALPDPGQHRIGRFSDPAVSGAPETQRKAAILAYYKTGSDRESVLAFIAGQRDEGASDFEIERALRMKHQTASARRNDLMNDGWIEDSGKRRDTDSGRPAVVWVLSDLGRSQYRREAAGA